MSWALGGNFSCFVDCLESLDGPQGALCCASKNCGSGHDGATAAVSHCVMQVCASLPLLCLPRPSSVQAAQGRHCYTMHKNQVFIECKGSDFILLLIINSITT